MFNLEQWCSWLQLYSPDTPSPARQRLRVEVDAS